MTAARKLEAVPDAPRRWKRPPMGSHERLLEEAIEKMPPEFIECRDLGHSWRKRNARWIASDNCYEQTLQCARCSTERVRFLGRYGAILESHYGYAEGYTVKGIGRFTTSDRDAVRLASIRPDLEEQR